MCGIVGYIGEKNAVPILIQGLKKLEYRGYDSAGIAIYNQNNIEIIKEKGKLENLENKLATLDVEGTIGIGHTRWATHGAPSNINAHPHHNKNKDIVIVHNGIIENYLSLKDDLQAKGYTFVSETDTEVVAHLIDYIYYNENKGENFLDSVIQALKKLHGSYALLVMNKKNPDEIIVAKKDSPLVVGIGQGENFIASDVPAILKYTREVYFIEDNEIGIISKDKIDIINMEKQPVNKEIFKVTWNEEAAEKCGYDTFMLKEIMEQPRVVRDTLLSKLKINEDDVSLDGLNLDKEMLDNINKIYVVACGTAYYAGLVGKYLIERLARIPVVAEVASEFRYKDPIIDKNTLVIVISQSGETADTLAALRLSKDRGAQVLGIVNVVGSSIARECDHVFYTLAGPEIAVASTKAYSAQLISMYLLSCHIIIQKGYITKEDFRVFKNELNGLKEKIEKILKQEEKIKQLAIKYKDSKNFFYIGRGMDFAVAMEGALKLKEIGYVHSEPYAAGELKHGPISLIEDTSLVIGLVTEEELIEKTISNLKEVKARGARVLAIAAEGQNEIEKVADDVIYVPKAEWMFMSVLANIPQQLFAYYIAKELGHDVDKPRNLAKSVTVE